MLFIILQCARINVEISFGYFFEIFGQVYYIITLHLDMGFEEFCLNLSNTLKFSFKNLIPRSLEVKKIYLKPLKIWKL